MPSLPRTVVRAALVAAVALVALVAWSSPAMAAFPAIEVTVVRPDGDQRQVWLSDIENPEIVGKYWVRSPSGEATPIDITQGNGISVLQLLEERQAEIGYGTIEIPRPDGSVIELTKEDVKDPRRQPMFYLDPDGQVHFLLPSTGPDDYNAENYFPITGSAFSMTQTSAELSVSVKASRKQIDPGESVTFTATVEGGPSNAGHVFNWDFNDGRRIADGNPKETHKFTKAGTYTVLATVKVAGETRSDPGTVTIQVGDEQKSDKDRQGGGDNGAADAPDSGSSTGSSGGGASYDGGSGYTPYTPSTPTPEPPPTPPSTPSAEPSLTPDSATSGTPVEGNLLADASDPPPTNLLESAARAARDGNRKDDAGEGAGVSEAALSIAGVLALLGLGAGIETRQGRLPRLRLPRRAA